MKPTRQEVLLSVIAVALCAIAIKLIFFGPSTRGDLVAITKIQDAKERQAALENAIGRMPVVWVRGGSLSVDGGSLSVDGGFVDVSGSSVSIER